MLFNLCKLKKKRNPLFRNYNSPDICKRIKASFKSYNLLTADLDFERIGIGTEKGFSIKFMLPGE
jgi:hypothetical protein